ncbi:type II toxin-antitoxin system death-on-curing family toxin [Frateuria defendens]|uniref:type II toxin-antitoxin system death-on-curing family toxin n=1 Tax=Frateuria defendens TaxID=2219559 RepID=UPI00066FE8A5|nr:type II toxin-antitoxin system death-on-curing family toxin [Frateuria defendens]
MPLIWIDHALVLAIHDRQLAEHGGAGGVRDEGLLESALARPQQMDAYADPEPDLADLAAALAHGLVRNHPFIDGNKRTAAVACEAFIELNGGRLDAEDEALFPQFLALADGRLPAPDFAAWLRAHLRTERVQEPPARYRGKAKEIKAR